MESNVLTEAFARLPSSDSRLNALQALIHNLTPYEWRFVHSLTVTRTFQFDIIGRLPVELVSHIFSYLDTSTPWQLQHVSHSWHQKLQSLAVLKPSLDSWYDGTLNLQHVDLEFCKRKARSIHAFRSASPSALPDCSFKICAEFSLTQQTEQLLRGDHLIWLANDRRKVHVLNMRTLTSKSIVPTARELIRSIDASDELVTLNVDAGGIVYVAEFDGHGPIKRFRVAPWSTNSAIACRRRTVAYVTPQRDRGQVVMHAYIWNYDTQQGRSVNLACNVEAPPGHRPGFPHEFLGLGLLLQPDTETLVLRLMKGPETNSELDVPRLLCYRFTFSGEYIDTAMKALDISWEGPFLELGDINKKTAADLNGRFMLHCNVWETANTVKTLCVLEFDEHLHTFTQPQHPRFGPYDEREQGHVVWWKDVFLQAGTKDDIIVHRGTSSHPCNDSVSAYNCVDVPYSYRRRREHTTRRERQIHSKQLLVNDRFIVRPYCDAFYVYCYDHTVHLPGKEGIVSGVGPWKVIEPRFASVSDCIKAMDGM